MCVIIVREPGVTIPHETIQAAVENNPHGWGYVIPDRGQLEVRRFFEEKGTDPGDVYDVLEDNPDKRIFLHLRWRTRGDKNSKNSHPFPVLGQRKHGMQAFLMHNGTLSDFGKHDDPMCDTYHFGQEIVTPLLERCMKYTGKKSVLHDPFVGRVIQEFTGNNSVMTIVDNYGNYLVINESKGSQKEGWWASNDYSFRSSYRAPEKQTTYHYGSKPNGQVWSSSLRKFVPNETQYEDIFTPGGETGVHWGDESGQESIEQSRAALRLPFYPGSTPSIEGWGDVTPKIGHNKPPVSPPTEDVPMDEPLELADKTSFCQLWDLKSLAELQDLNEEDLFDICTEFPEHAAILMRDLIKELYNAS